MVVSQSFGELVHKPLLVDLTVEEGQRLKVIYGSCAGFHAVDVDSGSVYDIYLPTHVRAAVMSGLFSFFLVDHPPTSNPSLSPNDQCVRLSLWITARCLQCTPDWVQGSEQIRPHVLWSLCLTVSPHLIVSMSLWFGVAHSELVRTSVTVSGVAAKGLSTLHISSSQMTQQPKGWFLANPRKGWQTPGDLSCQGFLLFIVHRGVRWATPSTVQCSAEIWGLHLLCLPQAPFLQMERNGHPYREINVSSFRCLP